MKKPNLLSTSSLSRAEAIRLQFVNTSFGWDSLFWQKLWNWLWKWWR